jgi:hypothetical protein
LTSPVDIDMDDDPREQISELEVQIEELAAALEWCRKTALASKAAMAFGGILLAATILGVVTFDPMAMVAGLAALLGGVVVFGSNRSTADQLSMSMRNAEALRASGRKSPSRQVSLTALPATALGNRPTCATRSRATAAVRAAGRLGGNNG